MPKVKGPLFSVSAHGTLANAITYKKGMEGQRVEKKPVPSDKRSVPQDAQRNKFEYEVSRWGGLTEEQKDYIDGLAGPMKMTGYNLSVKMGLLDRWDELIPYPNQPPAPEWIKLADSPTVNSQQGFEECGGMLWACCGGTKVMEMYDPVLDTWTVKQPYPYHVQSPGFRRVGDKLYLMGGLRTWIGVWDDACREYDPELNTWTLKSPMVHGREDYGTCVIDDIIYISSGFQAVNPRVSPFTEAYDPSTDTWTAKANIPYGLALGDMGCAYKGEFYMMNGVWSMANYPNTMHPSNKVLAYKPLTNTWRYCANTPWPRQYKDAATLDIMGGRIYYLGGEYLVHLIVIGGAVIYDPKEDTYIYPDIDKPGDWRCAGLCVYGGYIYMHAGNWQNNQTNFDYLYRYNGGWYE